jgi:hypothetical protein
MTAQTCLAGTHRINQRSLFCVDCGCALRSLRDRTAYLIPQSKGPPLIAELIPPGSTRGLDLDPAVRL